MIYTIKLIHHVPPAGGYPKYDEVWETNGFTLEQAKERGYALLEKLGFDCITKVKPDEWIIEKLS